MAEPTNGKSQNVWVFIEHRGGKIADVSLELLTKGKKLAESMNGRLGSIVIGSGVRPLSKETFRYGAEESILVDAPELKDYNTLAYARIITKLVDEHQPRIVLFGATVTGRDLAPRVASHSRSGLTADCTDLQVSTVDYLGKKYADSLLQIRPAFGGNIIATIITPDTHTQMATVREGVMEMHALELPHEGSIIEVPFTPDPMDALVTLVEQHREERKVNLKAAPVIVAGGYGMGSKEGFRLIHELAHVVGGEVAGSRAAVDAGFIPHERQVGQTGVTVRPKLYFAVGISGAIQHRAGMQEAKTIVAINTDPDAPIFEIAHYSIVGDAREVIPTFIDVYKSKLK
ncbi:MAG TPA: electron transfer flavoprotein subunit alpha/FixB family protein [Bacteroidota bacterium]|nr:electron transfer flavoprotein subunit alpha/FixB family protein [Bacteroidota bacterium]